MTTCPHQFVLCSGAAFVEEVGRTLSAREGWPTAAVQRPYNAVFEPALDGLRELFRDGPSPRPCRSFVRQPRSLPNDVAGIRELCVVQ